MNKDMFRGLLCGFLAAILMLTARPVLADVSSNQDSLSKIYAFLGLERRSVVPSSSEYDESSLVEKINYLESKLATIESNVETNKNNISTIKSDISTIKSNISTINTNISTVNANINSMKNTISSSGNSSTHDDNNVTCVKSGTNIEYSGKAGYIIVSSLGSGYNTNLTIDGIGSGVNLTANSKHYFNSSIKVVQSRINPGGSPTMTTFLVYTYN